MSSILLLLFSHFTSIPWTRSLLCLCDIFFACFSARDDGYTVDDCDCKFFLLANAFFFLLVSVRLFSTHFDTIAVFYQPAWNIILVMYIQRSVFFFGAQVISLAKLVTNFKSILVTELLGVLPKVSHPPFTFMFSCYPNQIEYPYSLHMHGKRSKKKTTR